jgi:hypothetical protein
MRPAWRLAAALAVVGALCLPRAAAAVVTGGCTAEGHSTSSSVDLTTATEWHLRSTDIAGGSGTSPVKMTAAKVYAYALGIEIPIASGTGDGGTTGAVEGVKVAPFAILGHRFTVAGSASGDGSCSGSITIILDDVSPALTVLGGGGIALFVVGTLGVLAGMRSRGGALRRVVAGIFGALGGAGLALALEQCGVTDPTSPVGLLLVLAGLLLGLLLTGLLRKRGAPVILAGDTPAAPVAPTNSAAPSLAGGPTPPAKAADTTLAVERLPPGYFILAPGSPVPGGTGAVTTSPGVAFPTGGGPPIIWYPAHGVWQPPGFETDPSDPARLFNPTTGQNAVWDDKAGAFIDAKTGQPLSYKQ